MVKLFGMAADGATVITATHSCVTTHVKNKPIYASRFFILGGSQMMELFKQFLN